MTDVHQSRWWLLALALPTVVACAEPGASPDTAPTSVSSAAIAGTRDLPAMVAARLKLAEHRQLQAAPAARAALVTVNGQDLVDALDIPAALQPTFIALTSPDDDATYVRSHLGRIQPRRGGTFLVLSTGRTGDDKLRAEPGFDFAPELSPDGDVSTLRFQVTVPINVTRMSFDFTFLSAESPEFVGSPFNDTFTAKVSDAFGADRLVATASVNESVFHPASATNVGDGPFLLNVDNPGGVNTVFDTGLLQDAGTTDYQHVDVPVSSGTVTIELDIRDVVDGILDSAVIVDNMAFSAIEVVDGHSDLVDDFGQIFSSPDPRLVALGNPVNAVASDGVTQLVVRGNVPGPGQVSFAVTSGNATDGQLSPADGSEAWGPTATVDAQLIAGRWYGIALYRSPPDYTTGPANATAPSRDAPISMTFTPAVGPTFTQTVVMSIVPPPVVVVPDVWTSCLDWQAPGGLMEPNPDASPGVGVKHPFLVTCANYEDTNSKSLNLTQNNHAVLAAVDAALTKFHDSGTAATRADVVGHGLGGVMARRYIDLRGFAGKDSFFAGRINRLITMDTPNLGSRLLDEMVRFRNFQKATDPDNWDHIKNIILAPLDVRIDDADGDVAIDELMTTSSVVKDIAKTTPSGNTVYHAIITTGGRSIPRTPAVGLLPFKVKTLMFQMENYHPLTVDADNQTLRQRLIYGPLSLIFCTNQQAHDYDQQDLFGTTLEQSGGLDAPFTSSFSVATANPFSGHFLINTDTPHTQRVVDLLNAPVEGGLFAAAMPSPGTVELLNSCPVVIPPTPPAILSSAAAVAAPGTISITSPAPGTIVTPGDAVTVTVETVGVQPQAVLIVGPGNAVYLEAPPFTTSFTIPVTSIGGYVLNAMAFYTGSAGAFAAPISLNLNITAALTSISVVNDALVLQRPGSTQQLLVVGTYSDGVRRNITHAPGTVYQATNLASVASVSATGFVTALGAGRATIAIGSGSVVTSIDVKVGEPACGDGVLDPGEQCDDGDTRNGDGCSSTCQLENRPPIAVCTSPTACNDPGQCFASVTDLGARSSDPDGQLLTITQSPASPYAVGEHAVSVLVSDGALEATCVAQLDVVDCEPPSLSCPADFTTECTGGRSAFITPPAATASDNCGTTTVQRPAAGPRPLGRNALTYTASDAAGNAASCTTTATVVDTTPPCVTVGHPAPLLPANHQYRTVSLDDCYLEVEDACGGRLPPSAYHAEITCVTADEPDNAPGNGDGNTTNDIVIVDSRTVKLRAERAAGGDGRVYKVGFRVSDPAGNRTAGTCSFVVPPDDNCPDDAYHPGHDCRAIDDGAAHSVCRP